MSLPLSNRAFFVRALLLSVVTLSGCASVLTSNEQPVQTYVLRAPLPVTDVARQSDATAASTGPRAVLQVRRPEASTGLDTDRIAVVRADRRFDTYAASRWTDPAPDMLESLVVESLGSAGQFRAVFGDAGSFAPDYTLNLVLRRFESQHGADGGAPTVVVTLDAALGRRNDRALLNVFTVQATQRATADRMTAVVAAFESATQDVLAQLSTRLGAALQNVDTPDPSISR